MRKRYESVKAAAKAADERNAELLTARFARRQEAKKAADVRAGMLAGRTHAKKMRRLAIRQASLESMKAQTHNEFTYSLAGRRTLRPYKLMRRAQRMKAVIQALAIFARNGWALWDGSRPEPVVQP